MKKPTLAALALLVAVTAPAQEAKTEDHAAHAAAALSGIKKEMIEGITSADFLKLSDKPKTAKITLVATFTAENYGMNFNGYAKGAAVYTIPTGWTVEVNFINPGPVPHSAIVIDKPDTQKLQVAEPWFPGGAVPKHTQGMSFGKADFSFVADEAGEYALACGFPAHAISGHWVALNVSDAVKVPTLKLGDLDAVEAK
ncbi:MAG: hypothetical protein H7A55_05265 [Verrucomicrobiaceae bacterium]|nr:hypothetical protein [Verrucomicrobiaceae bacterium]